MIHRLTDELTMTRNQLSHVTRRHDEEVGEMRKLEADKERQIDDLKQQLNETEKTLKTNKKDDNGATCMKVT